MKRVVFATSVLVLLVAAGCADSGDLNACGGRAALAGVPGESCGECGTWVCDGKDAVKCDDPGYNACGGCAQLEHQPGERCGECDVYECLNENAVHCVEKRNPCGGCSQLEAEPGQHCGECGTWVCDGVDSVRCEDPGLNWCGGCADIPSQDATCGECGHYECSGKDAVRCVDPGYNACGGCSQLPGDVGDPCGTCGEGAYACNGTDAMVCTDPDASMSEAIDLGEYDDTQNDAGDFYGRLYPGEDEVDWYVVKANDTASGSLDPWFRITVPQGTSYRMCAYFDSDEMDGCDEGTDDTYNSLRGCCGSSIKFDVGGLWGANSGGWIYIRIEYTSDSSPTCEPYHVTFGF